MKQKKQKKEKKKQQQAASSSKQQAAAEEAHQAQAAKERETAVPNRNLVIVRKIRNVFNITFGENELFNVKRDGQSISSIAFYIAQRRTRIRGTSEKAKK